MININERKEKRFLFLHKLYELTKGSELGRVNISDVYKPLGIDRKESSDICDYLKAENLAKPSNLIISITHQGIKEVEAALTDPGNPTEYFPPHIMNIINVSNMDRSVIQQGTRSSTQQVIVDSSARDDLLSFVSLLKENLDALHLKKNKEINADIVTIETQLNSGVPKNSIIKESLLSIKRILEGATGAVVAHEILTYIPKLLALL